MYAMRLDVIALGVITTCSFLLISWYSFNLSNNNNQMNTTSPLHLLLTDEGIGAQLCRISYAYLHAPFRVLHLHFKHSDHYNTSLNLCTYFELPTSIRCIGAHSSTLNPSLNPSSSLSLNSSTVRPSNCKNLSFSNVGVFKPSWLSVGTCFDGPLPYSPYVMAGFHFNAYSQSLLTQALQLLQIKSNKYLGVHWRRGDVLEACHEQPSMATSTKNTSLPRSSFPCSLDVSTLIQNSLHSSNNRSVYIATNELNTSVLQQLSMHGFRTSYELSVLFSKTGRHISLADLAIIDMLLLCKAHEFLYYGFSTMDTIVNHCRCPSGKHYCFNDGKAPRSLCL